MIGRDERRHVRVALSNGVFERIEIDETWLDRVSLDRLVSTIREAFETAYEEDERSRIADADQGEATQRFLRVTANAEEYRRFVRQGE